MKLTPTYSTLHHWSVVGGLIDEASYLDNDMARFDHWEGVLRFFYYFGATTLGDGNGVDLGRVGHSNRTC